MKSYTFVTAIHGSLRITAENAHQAWDLFELQGFMRGDCIEVR